MEYFFHLRKEEQSDVESVASDDSEEVRINIESQLYSVIHHNDLTQPLPPELDALYSIEHSDKGEVIVSFKKNSPENGIKKILDNNVNQIVPSQDENAKNIQTAATVNVENYSENKEENLYLKSKVKHGRYSDVLIDKNQLEELPILVKHGRYSDVLIDKNQLEESPILVNGCANEKEINWNNNLKSDFIPIEQHKIAEASLKLERNFEALFSKISRTNPHICDVKLRRLLSEISKTQKNNKRFRIEDITKRNRNFFFNPINFKNRLKDIKKNRKCLEFPTNFNSDFLNQNSCDKIIRSQIESFLMKNPTYTLKKIKKKLHRSGYMFPMTMIKNIFCQFRNNSIDQFKNPFSMKLQGDDKPLLINIIESSNTNAETSSIPVITISSDEESNNATDNPRLILNTNTKIVETEQSNMTQDYNETSTTKTSFRIPPSCPPKKWTKKMIRFYDKESKRLNTFDIQKIRIVLRKGSNPSDWRCCNDDYTKQCKRKDDNKNIRCINCWRFGHSAFSCKQPKQITICHMCGEEGHRWYSCPQKKCLNCGDPNKSFCSMCRRCIDYASLGRSCQICGSKNHPKELCTDLWRCYHSTTNNGPIVNTIQTSNTRKCCSYCSKKGHFAYECRVDSFGQYSNSEFVYNFHPLQQLYDYRDILLSDGLYGKLQTPEGDKFLQFLSDNCNSRIDIFTTDDKQRNVLRCSGTPEQWDLVRSEVMKFNQSDNVTKKKNKSKKRHKKKKFLPMSTTIEVHEGDSYNYSFHPEKRKRKKM